MHAINAGCLDIYDDPLTPKIQDRVESSGLPHGASTLQHGPYSGLTCLKEQVAINFSWNLGEGPRQTKSRD